MNEATSVLSLKCKPTDANKALYLVTAPPKEMSMGLIKELSTSLKNTATEAIIRSGDYPRGKGLLEVSVILSDITNLRKVADYFSKTISYISTTKRRLGIPYTHRRIEVGTFGLNKFC